MKWKWDGMVHLGSPLERRVVDKAEAEAEIDRLRKGILAAICEYGDAQSDGCDSNGAFDCVREAVDELLKDE